MLTGRYASNASSIGARRPWSLVGFNTFLVGAEPTIAHALRPYGYRTGFVGKYHLGFPLPAGQHGRSFGGSGRGLNYSQIVRTVERYAGFDEVSAVWGGNKQMAKSPHHPEWMASEACSFVRRAVSEERRFFLYFSPTVPHAPFALPDSLTTNVSLTPAGTISTAEVGVWEMNRRSLLARLTALGLVCHDYAECSALHYPGA